MMIGKEIRGDYMGKQVEILGEASARVCRQAEELTKRNRDNADVYISPQGSRGNTETEEQT